MSLKYLSQLAFLSTQGAGVVNVLIPTGYGIKHVSDCTVNSEIFSPGLYFRKTSHMRSFVKIKP